jgi:hypothetical protein
MLYARGQEVRETREKHICVMGPSQAAKVTSTLW